MTHDTRSISSNRYMEGELKKRLGAVSEAIDADLLTYVGPIFAPVDDILRAAVENIPNKKTCLAVILETGGGHIEVAERMVTVMRHAYSELWYIVPNYASSAGTVLVMSGDKIFMDYYSVLGPIDPQVAANGGMVPALGYLEKYRELVEKSAKGTLTTAEMTYFVERFDPAELHLYEQARNLSIELLQEWLVQWKFKDWSVTESTNKPVTAEMKADRAKSIADKLNDTKRWKSHSRGLSKAVIERDLNLKIDEIGDKPKMAESVYAYYRLLKDYMGRRGHEICVHTEPSYLGLGGQNDID